MSSEREGESQQRKRRAPVDFRPDDHDWSFFKSIKGGQKVRRDDFRRGSSDEQDQKRETE